MTSVARLRGDLWIMTYEFGEPDDPANPDNRGLVFVITGAQYGESAPMEAGIVSVVR